MKAIYLGESEACTSAQPPALSYKEGKGHLSVNPIYGCSVGCPYCLNLADGVGAAKRELAPIPKLLDALEQNRKQVRRLRLSLLDFCDPFDQSVAPVLRELVEGLAARLPGQVVLLTSRLHPGAKTLDWLASLPLRVSVFASLGDAAGRVPPVTSVERRLELLSDCQERGLHAVMLLRPLVREWTESGALRQLLAGAEADELVIAGLQRSPEIDASLRARGWPVPAASDSEVEATLRREVLELAGELLPGMPVSAHRSCAINRRWGLPCLVLRTSPDFGTDAPVPKLCRCFADIRTDEAESPVGRGGEGGSLVEAGAPGPKICWCFDDLRPDGTEGTKGRTGYCQLRAA